MPTYTKEEGGGKGWCARHPKLRCLFIVLAVLLLILVICAIIFWPRLLLICVNYYNLSVKIGPVPTADSFTDAQGNPAVPVFNTAAVSIPISIQSSNLWSLTVKEVHIDAYFQGKEKTALAQGQIDDLKVLAQDTAITTIEASTPQVSDESPVTLGEYAKACRLTAADLARLSTATTKDKFVDFVKSINTKTWPMDLKLRINFHGFVVDNIWIRDLQIPCGAIGAGVLVPPIGEEPREDEGCSDKDDSIKKGHSCIALFCSVSDLMCEGDPCMEKMQEKDGKSTPSAVAAAPTAAKDPGLPDTPAGDQVTPDDKPAGDQVKPDDKPAGDQVKPDDKPEGGTAVVPGGVVPPGRLRN